MKINVIVDNNQVGDAAPFRNHHLLRDEVCKIGEKVVGSLSTYSDFDAVKINDSKNKYIKLVNNNEYNINGKTKAGILHGNIFLIIDCGLLIRVMIKDPRDYNTPCDMRYPRNDLKTVIFHKNDFINFNSKIYGHISYDPWESIVWCNSNCRIIDRIDEKENGLLLNADCIFPPNPIMKIDEYYEIRTKSKIWGETNHFSIDF